MSKPVNESERRFEAWFVKRIEDLGGEALKLEVAGRRGWQDRLVIMPHGVTAYVELKAKKGRLSKVQRNKHKWLIENGHIAAVIWNRAEAKVLIGLLLAEMEWRKLLEERREAYIAEIRCQYDAGRGDQ